MPWQDRRMDSLCSTATDLRNEEKSAKHKLVCGRHTEIWCATPTNARRSCACILPMHGMWDFLVINFVDTNFVVMKFVVTNFVEMNFVVTNFVVKNFIVKSFLKMERSTGNSVRWSSSFKRILLFDVALTETEICKLKDHSWIQRKKMPSTRVPDQYLSIYTTFYPPSFSSDTTFEGTQAWDITPFFMA